MSKTGKQIDNEIVHRFSHKAMATIFEIIIVLDDKFYAEQAAAAAFAEIDRLEEELSRFHPNSEIAKINSLQIGEHLQLSTDTFDSLKAANHIFNLTNGIFDITAGEIIDKFKNKEEWEIQNDIDLSSKNIGMDKMIFDDNNYSLTLLSDDLIVDLGGFGKGYAIDKVCVLFEEWEIENALIHSGGSTVKGIGKLDGFDGWPITISNPTDQSQTIAEVILKNNSMSGSGIGKGTHIINPKINLPVKSCAGAWSITESAADSDAMSTTFMIMQADEILEFCNKHNFVSGLIVLNKNSIIKRNDILISDNWELSSIVL